MLIWCLMVASSVIDISLSENTRHDEKDSNDYKVSFYSHKDHDRMTLHNWTKLLDGMGLLNANHILLCRNGTSLYENLGYAANDTLSKSELTHVLPALLLESQSCLGTTLTPHEPSHRRKKPKLEEVWGYGFLCVTIINLCALMGLVFMPLMKKHYYQRLLMFMVALAVGTLAGSSLLFLIPEAFSLTEHGPHSYVWLSTVIMGGIYLFFVVERVLKIIMEWRQKYHAPSGPYKLPVCSPPVKMETRTRHDSESMNMTFDVPHQSTTDTSLSATDTRLLEPINGSLPGNHVQRKEIKGVAWMVIFGDGLHNFIDGLSIGAAFTHSLISGISLSLAVICEELPHELGDFAILLNAGMSMKQALGFNFLSACMCYIGLVVGILVGEIGSASTWIFAIAGGMFLYISLVDMLPEVNHAAESDLATTHSQMTVFLIQNVGIIVGYGIMLTLAIYSEQIHIG